MARSVFEFFTTPIRVARALYSWSNSFNRSVGADPSVQGSRQTSSNHADGMEPLHVLDGVSGRLRPGTMTLVQLNSLTPFASPLKCVVQVLGPPGHGKSAYLRAVSARLPQPEVRVTGR